MLRPMLSNSAARLGPMPLRNRSGSSSARRRWPTERHSEDWAGDSPSGCGMSFIAAEKPMTKQCLLSRANARQWRKIPLEVYPELGRRVRNDNAQPFARILRFVAAKLRCARPANFFACFAFSLENLAGGVVHAASAMGDNSTFCPRSFSLRTW